LLIIACGTPERFPRPQNTKIVFLSNREAPIRQFDIFMMNSDGTDQKNMTGGMTGIRSISAPRISPDGKEILFVAFEGDKKFLRKIDVSTRQVNPLTEVKIDVPDAEFSLDGQKIIYVDQVANHHQIFVMNRDGTQRKNISNNELDERDPSFSPDGRTIVYASRKNRTYSIWRMNVDGSNKERLTHESGNDRDPVFAPDGEMIAFSSQQGNNVEICTTNRNGSERVAIFRSNAQESEPQYAPDGSKILFLSNVRGMRYRDVLMYDFKKEKTTNLTLQMDFLNQNPCFTRDGEDVVFESVQFGNSDIYSIKLNDLKITRLTDNPKWDCAPDL